MREDAIMNEELVKLGVEYVRRGTGLTITPKQLNDLLKSAGVLDEVLCIGDIDTIIKEKLQQFLAESLLGEHWPDGTMEKCEFDDFISRFHKTAGEQGYQIP